METATSDANLRPFPQPKPGPSANPIYRSGQVATDFVSDHPAAGLLLAFGLGFVAERLIIPSGRRRRGSTVEDRFRSAYDPDHAT